MINTVEVLMFLMIQSIRSMKARGLISLSIGILISIYPNGAVPLSTRYACSSNRGIYRNQKHYEYKSELGQTTQVIAFCPTAVGSNVISTRKRTFDHFISQRESAVNENSGIIDHAAINIGNNLFA
jgi:hypothetical protein